MRFVHASDRSVSREPFWHVQLSVIGAIVLTLLLSNQLVLTSKYLVAGLEAVLLIFASLEELPAATKRVLAVALITLMTLNNVVSLSFVIHALISGNGVTGTQLLLSSVAIYLTNIIVFGFLYWELDGSQPDVPDFQFPQFTDPKHEKWQPTFLDYLYVSLTNATAFSPTDTMPLTHRAKVVMSGQSLISLVTIALVAARAVNILH
jgi:uncharacterized membrane protein